MQDRFKFRVWDKENKCLHYPTRYSNFTNVNGTVVKIESYPIANSAYLGKRISLEFDDAVIMQCTGLKDKNGKLIYEGDIVTYDDRDIYPHHTPILNAIIEMRKYQWCMIYYRKDIINASTRKPAEQKTWLGFDDFITSRIEVIGNVYENPELLEVEND